MDDEELEAGGSEMDTSGGYTLQHRLNASSRSLHWPDPCAR